MPKKKTTKKKTTKRSQTKDDIRSFTLRIPAQDVDWLDNSAELLQTSRQKILATMIRGLRLADEESNKQGTFFNFYTDQMASIIEDAYTRRATTRRGTTRRK